MLDTKSRLCIRKLATLWLCPFLFHIFIFFKTRNTQTYKSGNDAGNGVFREEEKTRIAVWDRFIVSFYWLLHHPVFFPFVNPELLESGRKSNRSPSTPPKHESLARVTPRVLTYTPPPLTNTHTLKTNNRTT